MAIKDLRKANGMTLEQVAQKIGATRSVVCMWEHGRRSPSAVYLLRLAKLFNVDPEELLDEKHSVGNLN